MKYPEWSQDEAPNLMGNWHVGDIYAQADPDAGQTQQVYRCPTCGPEQLRLTWDELRKRHAGYCHKCKKLWPLPRRTFGFADLREQLQRIPRQQLLELIRQEVNPQ